MNILSIDQGTTGTTVSVVDQSGKIVATINKEHPQYYPNPGWVEHDPEAIWESVLFGIRKVLETSRLKPSDIAGIGITNQRETVVMWDRKTHMPLYRAIVWQCRRTTDFCERLRKKGAARTIRNKTGLVIDPYFSASKIRWLIDNVSGVKAKIKSGDVAVGTVDTFLLWRLTGGKSFKTDVSNASRTQLMNIKTGKWDSDLLKIFGVPKEILAEISPSSGEFGKTLGVPGLPDGICIAGIAGDQQSALFGQGCFDVGDAKCTFGTGSFLLMNSGKKMVSSKSGLLTTVAWQLAGDKNLTYALEGGAFICGAAVQWLRDQLEFIESSSEVEKLARLVKSTEGVELVPAFVGLGAPYWDPEARAAILGLTRGSNRAHIARATLEAMALQNVDILLAMQKDLGRKMKALRVDGGAVKNDLLLQMQSDFLGVSVLRPKLIESTSLGAAYLAGLGVGFWPSIESIRKVWTLDREFVPEIKSPARSLRLKSWHHAIRQVRT